MPIRQIFSNVRPRDASAPQNNLSDEFKHFRAEAANEILRLLKGQRSAQPEAILFSLLEAYDQ